MIRLINGFADIYSMGKFVNEYSHVFKMETLIRICFKLFYRANTHDGNVKIYKTVNHLWINSF